MSQLEGPTSAGLDVRVGEITEANDVTFELTVDSITYEVLHEVRC